MKKVSKKAWRISTDQLIEGEAFLFEKVEHNFRVGDLCLFSDDGGKSFIMDDGVFFDKPGAEYRLKREIESHKSYCQKQIDYYTECLKKLK